MRHLGRWSGVAAWVGLALAAAPALAQPKPEATGGPPAPNASDDRLAVEYERHLGAGIQLYEAGQYDSAIQEFEAAFALDRQPSPLVNMALCFERLDSPEHPHPTAVPTAIAKLRQVLDEFGDELPADRRAAVAAKLTELTPLVGKLAVRIEPTEAQVTIGGKPQPPSALAEAVPVRSGSWTVRAELEGYAPAETTARITSGTTSSVALRLEPITGELIVEPGHEDCYVEIDGGQLTQGRWVGRLAPGTHEVRVFRSGRPAHTLRLAVVAGKSHTVRQRADGTLETDAPEVAAEPEPPQKPARPPEGELPPEPPRYTGWRIGASSAMLAAIHKYSVEEAFTWEPEHAPVGVALALRGGYRALEWLGFEVRLEYGVIWGDGHVDWDFPIRQEQALDVELPAEYTLQTWRFLGGLETVYPWESTIRFVGVASTGPVLSKIVWDERGANRLHMSEAQGIDFAVGIDVGAQLKLDRIVLDLVVQNVLQTTRGLEPDVDDVSESAFDNGLIWYIGPAVRPGYELF
ncbi:MAG: PEGA domain-containing protein [Deltaproteobacteria bacterium]|jgi:hypothetical protein|nr:PEGA domain-containing protein [Deltaproteobacteria bacterium]MBW2530334.1 PEGA domain-containing protein [Deltaproteobacteria bacterium]